MKWHKKMGIMSACGLGLLTMSGLAMSLTSCSKKEVKPEVVPYQYNYMQDMRLMLSDKAKLIVDGEEKRCLLFQINVQNSNVNKVNDQYIDVNKAWFALIEDIKNNELFLSFEGWGTSVLTPENKNWSGKIPEEINLPSNVKLTYNNQEITTLPIKAINVSSINTSIPDWNDFKENIKNLDYCNNGIYINKQFILNFANANNIEYIYPNFIIFDDNTNKNIDNNENINFKFPSSIKWLKLNGEIVFNENSFNKAFPNIILDLSDCNKLVEIERIKNFTSVLLIQNLIEIKLSSTIKRFSGSIFRINWDDKSPVKINLDNLLFIGEGAFDHNYFPNNKVVLNDKCKYCQDSFTDETEVIGGIMYY